MRLAVLALGAVAASALLPASALAVPSWLSPTDLSAPGQNAIEPQVAVDGQGDAVAVWQRYDGTHEVVQAATRAAGGAWTAAVSLSVPGQNAYGAQVAVDPQGDAVAVWEELDGTDMIIRAATRATGGTWSAPVSLSEGGQNAYLPEVAVDSQGDAVAVWERYDGTYWHIQSSSRAAGGSWSAAVNISEGGQSAEEPQIAVDPQGDAIAIWKEDGVPERVQSAARAAGGGTWSTPLDLSADGEDAYRPQIAVDAQGEAVAVWLRSDGSNEIAQGASRTPGGTWSTATDLSQPGHDAEVPQVAVDPAGDAVAVWTRSDGSDDIVQGATRTAGGGWAAAVDLSAAGQDAYSPAVAASQGDAVAVWTRSDGSDDIVQGATRTAGGGWAAAVDLSAAGESAYHAQVAVDPDGDAVAVWRRYDGTDEIIQAAGYDVAGPQLRGLSIPATGTAGQPVSFSVAPLDVWSAVGQTTWSFGDGGTAVGAAVAHTYGAPGTYTVKVTSGDAVGNTSTATGTVTVVAPPATPTRGKGTRGRAKSGRLVEVKGRAALLALTCPGAMACSGVVELTTHAGVAGAKGAAGASSRRRPKRLILGAKTDFSLAAGKHKTVKVTISRKARTLLAAAGRKGLKAQLTGSGVVGRAVVLKPVGRHRRAGR